MPVVKRYCPACRRRTYTDGFGERRCECGWHQHMTVKMVERPKVIDPAAEVRKTKAR